MKPMNTSCKYPFALLFFVCITVISFGQSKKEQIEILKMKLDSIENVSVQLNKEVQQKKIQTDSLQALIQIELAKSKKVSTENADLKEKLKKEHENYLSEEAVLKSEITLLKNDLAKSRKDIQLQSDSIRDLNSKHTVKNFYDVIDFSEASEFEFVPRAGAKDKDFNGVFKSYYSDEVASIYTPGKKLVYATGPYQDGFKNGMWIYYNCDASIRVMGNYVNGIRDGKWKCLDYCFDDLGFIRLTIMLSYYEIDLEGCNDYSKLWQTINYTHGNPSDTIFISNLSGKMALQIVKHGDSMHLFYDNKQAFSNQALRLDSDGFLVGAENAKDLKIYNRNGGLKYSLKGDERNCEEISYYDSGVIYTKCVVKNEVGNWLQYDEKGKVIQTEELGIHAGKFGIDCICQ
jgi:antitoxin component YwqK of YwqJK toxin-antitoxin module